MYLYYFIDMIKETYTGLWQHVHHEEHTAIIIDLALLIAGREDAGYPMPITG